MSNDSLTLLLELAPLLIGIAIAAANADAVNNFTERIEAWIRARYQKTSGSSGRFTRYVANPILLMLTKFSDWTDGFTHRGLKNGTRVAAGLYAIALWLFLIYIAVALVIAIVILFIVLAIVFKFMSGADTGEATVRAAHAVAARRGKKTYAKTGMFTEEETGRTDEEGRIYRKTGMFTEEEVGRVDDEGKFYKKTGMFTEEETGRTDEEGRLFEKTGMFTEEEVGRVDSEGRAFKKTGIFTEEETGRFGKD